MGSHTPITGSLVLFDGVCNLCSASVQFIIRRDPNGNFKFASLQSDIGQKILREYSLNPGYLHSIILIHKGKVYERSDTALQISRLLKNPWPVLYYLFWPVPRFIRDLFYAFIARNRYRFFGKRNACMIPTDDLRSRFL